MKDIKKRDVDRVKAKLSKKERKALNALGRSPYGMVRPVKFSDKRKRAEERNYSDEIRNYGGDE